MTLQERLQSEMTAALKAGNKERRAALSFLVSEIKTAAVNKRVATLTDADTITLLQKQMKQRQETLESVKDGRRPEVRQKTTDEIALIQEFLPEAPSEEQTTEVARTVIAELGASSMKDMGKVMAEATNRLSGVDKTQLSKIVRGLLV